MTGNAGAGKTSLAHTLSIQQGLPYFGLDSIVWKPRWLKTPAPERQEKELAIINNPAWVVDGVSFTVLDAADMVVFLDYPRYKCFWRALLRNLPYLFHSRPSLPKHCPEITIILTLVRIIWRFPKHVRPKILTKCCTANKYIYHIRNNDDLERFLASVCAATPKINS